MGNAGGVSPLPHVTALAVIGQEENKRQGATHYVLGREAHDPLGGTGMVQALEKKTEIDTHAAHELTKGTQQRGDQDTPPQRKMSARSQTGLSK